MVQLCVLACMYACERERESAEERELWPFPGQMLAPRAASSPQRGRDTQNISHLGLRSPGLGSLQGGPAYLVQMTSSCRLPWQRWHWVQRREKRSSRAFRWDTWR